MEKGKLAVISGFSGVGKGTIVKELLKNYDGYALSISATTRAPRPGEVDGVDYFFITKEEFENRISEDRFLEYNNYVGNYYGTPKDYIEKELETGKNIILEIEMHGGLNVKKVYPEAMLIFVVPPDSDTLRRRLEGRGTENPDEIEERLKQVEYEKIFIKDYDYVVINDDLDKAVDDIDKLIKNR